MLGQSNYIGSVQPPMSQSGMPGDKSELKPGVKIFIAAANKQPDGNTTDATREFRQGRAHAADVIAVAPRIDWQRVALGASLK
jgi:hypothetical protein